MDAYRRRKVWEARLLALAVAETLLGARQSRISGDEMLAMLGVGL